MFKNSQYRYCHCKRFVNNTCMDNMFLPLSNTNFDNYVNRTVNGNYSMLKEIFKIAQRMLWTKLVFPITGL
jgi:hypothetical protein